MADFKNLLQTMSSVFNETKTDKCSVLDINDDKTLKWKTLHHNQYASKKEGKKIRVNCEQFDSKNKNKSVIDSEEDSWDCNSSNSSDHKSFIRTRKRTKNLLQTMSSVFNETKANKSPVLDINNDKTVKWKTLHHNQYVSKKEGKKIRVNCEQSNTINKNKLEIESEEDSWECNSSNSSDHKSFVRTRKRTKEILIERRLGRKKDISSKLLKKKLKQSNDEKSLGTNSSTKCDSVIKKNGTLSLTNVLNRKNYFNSTKSSNEDKFYSFGQTIALQLKELHKFNQTEAHRTMQEIQNLIATRIVKILAQIEGNDDLILRSSPSPE